MTTRPTIAITAVFLAMGLGACSRSDDPAQIGNNTGPVAEAPTTQPAVVTEAPAAPSPPVATATASVNVTAEAPPEVAPAPDDQMMDDASATGMTARSSRGEPATDEAAPVEPVEKK